MRACLKRCVAVLMFFSIATVSVRADDAPVYEVDNYPPQFDGQRVDTSSSQVLSQEQRLIRIEQQVKNQSHSDLTAKIETMRTEVQSLRGQVEELTHQLQQVQNQQRSMYTDLDKRFGSKQSMTQAAVTQSDEKPARPAVNISKTPSQLTETSHEQPNVVEEQQIYQTAYDLIKVKKYNDAVATLQKMLRKYPSGQFAANAHYWLGELYGLLNKNDQSADEFTLVVKNYPDSPKIADAQLKLGLIYAGQFKWLDAKAAFKKVIAHYPGTPSARLASEQLKQLKQAQAASAH